MFRPNGSHLFIRGKLATGGGGFRNADRSALAGSQWNYRLIFPGQLQEDAGYIVLHFRRQAPHGLNGVFKQLAHAGIIVFYSAVWKTYIPVLLPRRPYCAGAALATGAALAVASPTVSMP